MRAPRLLIEIALEDPPAVRIVANSFEDELRLRSWLRRSGSTRRLSQLVAGALDERDERRAA